MHAITRTAGGKGGAVCRCHATGAQGKRTVRGGGSFITFSKQTREAQNASRTIATAVGKMKIQFAFILTILVLKKNAPDLDVNFWK